MALRICLLVLYVAWQALPFPYCSSVVLRCRSCKHDTSLMADTVMQRTPHADLDLALGPLISCRAKPSA